MALIIDRETISQLLAAYLKDATAPAWELRVAQRFGALPLYADWTVVWAVTPNGDVLVIAHDEEDPAAAPETDNRLRNIALFRGGQRWPALAAIIPKRVPDAPTCIACDGTGLVGAELPAKLQERLVCWCGGIGWLPVGSSQMPRVGRKAESLRRWWQLWRRAT